MDRLTADWIAAADAFLFGRKTYELFADYWSQVTDPGDPRATRLNALPKYVVSTTLDRVEWNNSVLLEGDVAEEVAKLKRQPGNELQVHGSAALVRTLMKHGHLAEGQAGGLCWDSHRWGCSCLAASPAVSLRYPWPMRSARLLLT
jgi:dihydrofolate reductase